MIGEKYKYDAGLSDSDKAGIRENVLRDVRTVLVRGQDKEWIRYLSNPEEPGKPAVGADDREDDLEAFHNDPAFSRLVSDDSESSDRFEMIKEIPARPEDLSALSDRKRRKNPAVDGPGNLAYLPNSVDVGANFRLRSDVVCWEVPSAA